MTAASKNHRCPEKREADIDYFVSSSNCARSANLLEVPACQKHQPAKPGGLPACQAWQPARLGSLPGLAAGQPAGRNL